MIVRQRFGLFVVLAFSVWLLPTTVAQDSACSSVVETALTIAQESCTELGRNVACYGHNELEAQTTDETPLPGFTAPGDIEAILNLQSISTSPLDESNGLWGIGLLSLQANLPDTLPGQNVTFVIFGESRLEAREDESFDAPLQAFYFSAGVGTSSCEEAPDGLLIQAPQETSVNFLINGIEVEVGSTTYIQAANDGLDSLTFNTLAGTVQVTSGEMSQTIEPGYQVTTNAEEPASEPEPYEYDAMVHAPTSLLPDAVSIPVVVPGTTLDRWVETVIYLEAGESFSVSAAGLVNVFNDCEVLRDRGDIPADYDCAAMITGPDARIGAPTDAPDPTAYPTIEESVDRKSVV